MYTSVHNNPINHIDPEGLETDENYSSSEEPLSFEDAMADRRLSPGEAARLDISPEQAGQILDGLGKSRNSSTDIVNGLKGNPYAMEAFKKRYGIEDDITNYADVIDHIRQEVDRHNVGRARLALVRATNKKIDVYAKVIGPTGHIILMAGDIPLLVAAPMRPSLSGAAVATGEQMVQPGARQLARRADEIHGALDPIAQNHRTAAVVSTERGLVVGGGVRDLSPVQRQTLLAGETAARLAGQHAEPTALAGTAALALRPRAIGASQPFCLTCQNTILTSGGKITSERTAVFPRGYEP